MTIWQITVPSESVFDIVINWPNTSNMYCVHIAYFKSSVYWRRHWSFTNASTKSFVAENSYRNQIGYIFRYVNIKNKSECELNNILFSIRKKNIVSKKAFNFYIKYLPLERYLPTPCKFGTFLFYCLQHLISLFEDMVHHHA